MRRVGTTEEACCAGRFNRRIRLEVFRPSPALAPYITHLWVYDIPIAAHVGEPVMLTVLPDVFTFACFLCGDPLQVAHKHQIYTSRSAVSGFRTLRFDILGHGDLTGVAVRFTSWGLRHFLPGSAEAFADSRVACRDIFPCSAIEDLESKLFHLPFAHARVRCVEKFLLTQLRNSTIDRLTCAVAQSIVRDGGQSPLSQLACDFELSERTLERRFRRAIGVGPKKYARVVRLQNAFRQRAACRSWADIAQTAGYFDQAHLIRECRDMVGVAPETVFASPPSQTAQAFQTLAQMSDLSNTVFC